MALTDCLARHLKSLRCLLVVSFILLMVIAGFLGFGLTYLQSQKSMNEIAETSVEDLIAGIVAMVQAQISDGHQMNLHEVLYFKAKGIYLDNWLNVFYHYRPFTISALKTARSSYSGGGIVWLPNHGFAVNWAAASAMLGNFNNTVCNDTSHFPGSNCSVFGAEAYMINTTTGDPLWDKMIYVNLPYNLTDQVYWKTGVIARKPTAANPYSLGYSAIFPFYQITPPLLNLQINAPVYNANGEIAGQVLKSLFLKFVGVYLRELVASHKLLVLNGRAFSFELGNHLLTGASHGDIYLLTPANLVDRYTPSRSPDPVISLAGQRLEPRLSEVTSKTSSLETKFKVLGHDFVCMGKPFIDEYGLAWMIAVCMSLTDLFSDINTAAMKMLGFTALGVILLSIFAGIGISVLVGRSLNQLSKQMAKVADMDLDGVKMKQSFFYEVSTMQGYFHQMVAELKEFRAFLPEAIMGSEATEDPPSAHLSGLMGPMAQKSSGSIQQQATSTTFSDKLFNSTMASEGNGAMMGFGKQLGSISKRMISMMFVDIQRFHTLLDLEPAKMMSVHSDIIRRVSEMVQGYSGLGSSILGDKQLVFWNIRPVKSDHAFACVACALQLYEEFGDQKEGQDNESDPRPSLRISCTMGSASFGTMGTSTSRAFLVLSPIIARAALIQKMGKLFPLGVTVDGVLYEHVHTHYRCRLAAFSVFPDRLAEHRIYEALGPNTTNAAAAAESNPTSWLFTNNENTTTADHEEALRSIFANKMGGGNCGMTNGGRDAAAAVGCEGEAALLQWYRGHSQEVAGLVHPRWGLTMPTEVLL